MKMPCFFIAHGSPMNALADNEFTQFLKNLSQNFPRPKSILCISAHWMTKGVWVTGAKNPKTIHDFYGFPQPLFEIQYPAPGTPELAQKIADKILLPHIQIDPGEWGIDHGTWSVLLHLYPQADIPVVQLSLDMTQPPEFHFQLGQKINFLREEGTLIIGSGNVVHNLRRISWEEKAKVPDWALEFDSWVKQKIDEKDFSPLVNKVMSTTAGQLSVPTWDHYYPLLTILGCLNADESAQSIFEGFQNSSISMRTIQIGKS